MDVELNIKPEPTEPATDNQEPQPVPMETQDQPVKSEPVEADQPEGPETEDSEMKTVEVKPEAEPEPEVKTESEPGQEAEHKPDVTEETKPELDKSLDDHAVSDTAPSFTAPAKLAGPSIRINLMNPVESGKTLERRESVISNSSDADSSAAVPDENSKYDPDCIIQPPKHENPEPKPKLVGRKLQDFPVQVRGSDTSGLCSIMWLCQTHNRNPIRISEW